MQCPNCNETNKVVLKDCDNPEDGKGCYKCVKLCKKCNDYTFKQNIDDNGCLFCNKCYFCEKPFLDKNGNYDESKSIQLELEGAGIVSLHYRCYEDNYTTCDSCGITSDVNDKFVSTDNATYCKDCAKHKVDLCDICKIYSTTGSVKSEYTDNVDSIHFCDNCEEIANDLSVLNKNSGFHDAQHIFEQILNSSMYNTLPELEDVLNDLGLMDELNVLFIKYKILKEILSGNKLDDEYFTNNIIDLYAFLSDELNPNELNDFFSKEENIIYLCNCNSKYEKYLRYEPLKLKQLLDEAVNKKLRLRRSNIRYKNLIRIAKKI